MLPEEVRKEIEKLLQDGRADDKSAFYILQLLFGSHNLKYRNKNQEKEELVVYRNTIVDIYKELSDKQAYTEKGSIEYMRYNLAILTLIKLFGTKCLPENKLNIYE